MAKSRVLMNSVVYLYLVTFALTISSSSASSAASCDENTPTEAICYNNPSMNSVPADFSTTIVTLFIEKANISTLANVDFINYPLLEKIIIINSNVEVVAADTFENLTSLVYVDLSYNSGLAGSVDVSWILGLLNSSVEIILQGNTIETMSVSDVSALPARISSLDLTGQPLHCNCQLVWLHNWTVEMADLGGRVIADCASPLVGSLVLANTSWMVCYPPKVIDMQPGFERSVEVYALSAVNLTCTATGDPAPTIDMTGTTSSVSSVKSISQMRTVSTVVFPSITASDAGMYECIATNSLGNTATTFNWLVLVVLPPLTTTTSLTTSSFITTTVTSNPTTTTSPSTTTVSQLTTIANLPPITTPAPGTTTSLTSPTISPLFWGLIVALPLTVCIIAVSATLIAYFVTKTSANNKVLPKTMNF